MKLNDFSIMYVEDDEDIREFVNYILKPKCKNFYLAENGSIGLDLYKEHKPDIVLSDLYMPQMDGLQMSKKLKTIDPELPIVLVTSFDDGNSLKEAINCGIDKYIQKPFSVDSFFESLNSVVKVLHLKKEKQKIEKLMYSQSKIASMGEMIGNIAHQWRQPLNVISTAASGCILKYEINGKLEGKEIMDNTQEILSQVTYLSNTIDDFRDFYTTNDKCEMFNIKNTLYKSIKLVRESYRCNNIEVILDLDDYYMEKRENELVQVLINIFNNAKDAFILNNIDSDKRFVFINLEKNEDKCTLFIKDSANGIDEKILDRIFEPYFTTKFASKGTGIGLYMSHKIIKEHFEGEITAFNEAYEFNAMRLKGACFKITF